MISVYTLSVVNFSSFYKENELLKTKNWFGQTFSNELSQELHVLEKKIKKLTFSNEHHELVSLRITHLDIYILNCITKKFNVFDSYASRHFPLTIKKSDIDFWKISRPVHTNNAALDSQQQQQHTQLLRRMMCKT